MMWSHMSYRRLLSELRSISMTSCKSVLLKSRISKGVDGIDSPSVHNLEIHNIILLATDNTHDPCCQTLMHQILYLSFLH